MFILEGGRQLPLLSTLPPTLPTHLGDLQIPESDEVTIQAAQEMPLVPVVSHFQDQNYNMNLSRLLHVSVYAGEQPQ